MVFMHIDQIIPQSYLNNLNKVGFSHKMCISVSCPLTHPSFGIYSVLLQQPDSETKSHIYIHLLLPHLYIHKLY